MSTEQKRLDELARWYLDQQLDLDRRMINFRYQALSPHFAGKCALELGSAEGEMTRLLLLHFDRLVIVDAAGALLDRIPESPKLEKVRSLFESFEPGERFDTIVAEHVLEHVEDPVQLLRRMSSWLAPAGRLLVGVPNANSIHRLAAVKMGLLANPHELNARDREVGHRRVYDRSSLSKDVSAAGLRILHSGGVFLKPLSNKQIDDHWSDEMIEGFAKLGADLPDLAAEIYAVCVPDV